jgi:hypothetical protein
MRIPARPRTLKPLFSRCFTRLWMSRWILPEVFGWGRWWAVGDSDCPSGTCPHKTQVTSTICEPHKEVGKELPGGFGEYFTGCAVLRASRWDPCLNTRGGHRSLLSDAP